MLGNKLILNVQVATIGEDDTEIRKPTEEVQVVDIETWEMEEELKHRKIDQLIYISDEEEYPENDE